MLYQNYSFEQSQNQIFSVLKDLQIAKLLYKANIRKGCGLSALEIFQRLVMLVFHGKNLFRSLESKHNDHAVSKNTYYRFLSNPSFNWKKFLLLLAIQVATALRKLTCKSRVTVLVLDDSVLRRNRSKAVELLAKVYDHVFHEFVRGFNLLALGWSDGFSFIPVSFVLLSSAKLRNRYQEVDKDIDHRTNGWKARMESMMQKPEAALRMVESALAAGIHADYILMDSWFTTEPFVKSLSDLGQDVIGMVKDMKQRYYYNGHLYTLPQLAKIAMDRSNNRLYRSLMVRTRKHHLPVRIVFARYTFLEWLRRQETDPKTYGGLFFALCEDVQDMERSDALRSLMSLFMETINGYGTEDTETIKSKVSNWIASQSRYIKGLFPNLCWES